LFKIFRASIEIFEFETSQIVDLSFFSLFSLSLSPFLLSALAAGHSSTSSLRRCTPRLLPGHECNPADLPSRPVEPALLLTLCSVEHATKRRELGDNTVATPLAINADPSAASSTSPGRAAKLCPPSFASRTSASPRPISTLALPEPLLPCAQNAAVAHH